MLSTPRKLNLKKIASLAREHIIRMSFNAQSAHTGGALSCVELLVSLYFIILNINPDNPEWKNRDRLVFSKAHDAKALYAVLCLRGFFSKEILGGYEINGGMLPGHSTRGCVPGVEVTAGALGHGLPIATGMAYVGKIDHKKHRVFTIISDGECDAGSTWEAVLFAGHHKLDNLIVIVDYNKLQGYGFTKDVLDLEPFAQKWQSFNWDVKEISGHDFKQINDALCAVPFKKNKPSVVIAHTIKGLGGVKQHVNQISSQYKPPTLEEVNRVIQELGKIV